MAALPSVQSVQVVNADLAPERQKLLREKLDEYFKALSKRSKAKKRLIYTANADESPLDRVLKLNSGADALLTGFAYDAKHSEEFKEQLAVATPADLLNIDPELRYPVIAEMHRFVDDGQFRHRKLILVGDIHDKIGQYIRSALPVQVQVFTDPDRTKVTKPIQIVSIDRLTKDPTAQVAEGRPLPIAAISSLRVADIDFHGIVHMPEEANRFVLKDQTLLDTARKLYFSDGVQELVEREMMREERLNFVRGKRIFIVLDEDLEHVISERFKFDQMDNLWRHHTVEEALKTLESGKFQGIVDYFESNGYNLVFDVLDAEERDKVLLAVLGNKLGDLLAKEVALSKPSIAQLEDSDLESIFYNLPQTVVDSALEGLKAKSYERFLSMVPPKIREGVILEFLGNPKQIAVAWRGIGAEQKKEILSQQAALIHAVIFLLNSPLSKQKFPGLKFEFARSYDSSMLGKMGPDELNATFKLIAKSIEQSGVPQGALTSQLKPEECEHFVVEYIKRNASDFYNRLNPLVRKQIWVTVGTAYRDHISKSLHALDKIEILKGNKETSVALIFDNPEFLAYLKSGEDQEFVGSLFLSLKKLNKQESRTALLKKVLSQDEWRAVRIKGFPKLLMNPDSGMIMEKLSEHVEELEFRFDSLVCTRADYERLKECEPVKGALVTLVDDLVDPSLFNLFSKGDVSREDYDEFRESVEKQLGELQRQVAAKEAEDPVGAYLLETMQMVNQMTNAAVTGELTVEAVEQIDERLAVRQRMLDSMMEHTRRIDEFLQRAETQGPALKKKHNQLAEMAKRQKAVYDQEHKQAGALMAEVTKLQQLQAKANEDRKTVALTQKQLSVQFFELIQPLILDKVRSLGNPLKSFLKMVGLGDKEQGAGTSERVIFKFSDEQIAQILRYKVVFCSKDTVLAQFIATCLRIDHLEGSLFTLATADNLPHKSNIDILFYGPGYSVSDFSDSVKENRMVEFADQSFYDRLLGNEKKKARTKAALDKSATGLKQLKPRLLAASQSLKAQQAKKRKIEEALEGVRKDSAKLAQNVGKQREKRHELEGEQELLQTRMAEVDQRFEGIKTRLAEALGGAAGGSTAVLAAGRAELAERLRGELTALNAEMARMMFIKGVKDAGAGITLSTQAGIIERIEAREVYRFAKRPFRKLIVADDGSNISQNLKRAFVNVALPYFKLRDMAIQDISIKRFLAMAENANGSTYPFVALFTDRTQDDYVELKLTVKRINTLLPETYQLLMTPFGDLSKIERSSPLYKNLAALQDNCTLVNAALGDFSDPTHILKVLQEKAPLS